MDVLRVLLVEDDEGLRGLFELVLRRAGHEITTTASGPEALSRVERGLGFELLVTDVSMPGMSGLELALRLGERMSPPPRVLYLSGRHADDLDLPPGAHMLQKPFDPASLVQAVRRACGCVDAFPR